MNNKIKSAEIDLFFEALRLIETSEEYYDFFEDISTVAELQSFGQRLTVAKMLNDGALYTDISKATGASTATISRISKCLHYGANGYQIVLNRMKNKE